MQTIRRMFYNMSLYTLSQIMKQEHEYRLEQMRQHELQAGPSSGGGPRTIGGGRPMAPKSLRGGGGVTRSFNWGDGSAMNRSNSMTGEDLEPNGHSGAVRGGNGVPPGPMGAGKSAGGSATAMAVVSAEAVPVEEYDDDHALPTAPAPKPASKSSVFSRMLKGQK
jgi:hypothetical protein